MADPVRYTIDVDMVREVILVGQPQLNEPGEGMTPVPLAAVLGDDDKPSDALIVAQLAETMWGWRFQDRFAGEVVHRGKTFRMTSAPVRHTGTTWVDARELTMSEIRPIYEEQQRYIAGRRRKGRPIGALPHGKDRALIFQALDRGERILVTRTGDVRWWDPVRDRLLESASL